MAKGQRDDTRSRVLAAAIDTFAERGFAGASMSTIAERAGMTIGAIYSNFAGKRELFLEALRHATGRPEEAPTELEPLPPREQLLQDGQRFIEGLQDDPRSFRLLVWTMLAALQDEELREVVSQVLDEQRLAQEDILRRSESQLDPATGALILNSLALGYAIQHLLQPETITSEAGLHALAEVASLLTQ